MSRTTKGVILIVGGVVLLVVGALALINYLRSAGHDPDPDPGGALSPSPAFQIERAAGDAVASTGAAMLQIRLSQGQPGLSQAANVPVTAGQPLTDAALQQLLQRLPPLSTADLDVVPFRLPEESLPPPRPGATVATTFPPTETGAPADNIPAGPLEVVRFAPEGDVSVAPFVSLTFNQSMVPLGTLSQLAASEVPVQLTPALPGVWEWIGTRTLRFSYQEPGLDRLPMATEYRVTLPAGVTATSGAALAAPVTWSFRTPPPQVTLFHPQGESLPLQPLFFVAFDQLIDPAAALAAIQVEAAGRSTPLRLATADEIEADATVARLAEQTLPGRWLAFRPSAPLPSDAAVNVSLGPGLPSAEGPLTSPDVVAYALRTYAPLRVVEHRCGWDETCPPGAPFSIHFNNPLDETAFSQTSLTLEPDLPGAVVSVYGNNLEIRGASVGRTTYTVRLSAGLSDIFGQSLGREERLTFRVGSAEPALSGPNRALITLDPSAPVPTLPVWSINYETLRVRLYAVTPADWPAYLLYRQAYNQQTDAPTPPGRLVQDEMMPLEDLDDVWIETAIDLTPALTRGSGHVIVVVEPPAGLLTRNRYRPVLQAWVQSGALGLDAYSDAGQMVAWASELRDGAPLSGVSLTAPDGTLLATTDADGVARFDLPAAGLPYLTAQQGETTTILPPNDSYWDESGWRAYPVSDSVHWFVLDDRQLYRPGEEVHLKGWVRQVGGGQSGDVGLMEDGTAVRYHVSDPQGNELVSGAATLTALGGFDFAFTLPVQANLGYAQVALSLQGGRLADAAYYHSFQIQEFRRPEFEVAARPETAGPYYLAQTAVVAVSANYYAGGPLPNAEVTWRVTSAPGHYTPPNWSDYIFGRWTPWWLEGGFAVRDSSLSFFPPVEAEGLEETFRGVTDALGNHYLQLDFAPAAASLANPQPVSVIAEATVMDVNRQAWSASAALLVHPAELYVGLRSAPMFVTQGTPLEVQAVVVDVDGNPVAGRPITVRAARLEWKYRLGQWLEEETETQTCAVTSAMEPVSCTFETPLGGEYRLTAMVVDDQGRANESQFTRWVSGGQRPVTRSVEEESVALIPNQELYNPGEVAEILVQAPFSPAEGLLILARSGVVTTQRFRMEGETHILRVPIEAAYLPNVTAQVELVGAALRLSDAGDPLPELPARPAYASGQLNLPIATHSRALQVALTPAADQLAPGEATSLDIAVTDAAGRPVAGAEMAVVVVDEAILALTAYDLADPLSIFYFSRSPELSRYRSRSAIVLANPQQLAADAIPVVFATQAARSANDVAEEALEMAAAPADEKAEPSGSPSPIEVRSDFNPLALFAPAVSTDAQGRAQVTVQLPDNLTRYRIMVVAVAGGQQFGTAEGNLTARLPLMVRPTAPRFLRFGDQFALPVVIQNQTDAPLTVEVALEAFNLTLENGATTAGRLVSVPAHDRVEVRFPAAALSAGTARFQVVAAAGAYRDAAVVDLPVYTPATTEAFAVYGVLDEGALAQPILTPTDVFPQFGALEITTSSTALQALTDAVLYLVNYRFDCSEQLASRILAVAALRPVLSAFAAQGLPDPATLEAAVQADIEQLERLQNGDGGFACWRPGDDSIPFYTVHAAHALQRAQSEGFVVSAPVLSAAHAYLQDIEGRYPTWYSQAVRWSISAYALWVRQALGDSDPAAAATLLAEAGLDNLSLEAVAWLWPILDASPAHQSQAEAIERHIHNRAVETAGAANFVTGYGEDAYLLLHSDRRADALILQALITVAPQSDLIPKVVNGLLAHQVQGRWNNTQENVFVLLALDSYFQTFEAQTPDFVALLWLGETYAGQHVYAGRSTERYHTEIPLSYLVQTAADADGTPLILSKEGVGRLYYRLGLRYAPTDLTLEPVDRGFVVTRVYEAVDDPGDVWLDANGVWHVRAGARVRVRLSLVADSRRYHVALVDPLPAGLEPVNPALSVSGDLPQAPGRPVEPFWWWYWTWYEHQNLRDDRAEAFATLLWDGIYDYTYVTRATTPGTFVVPPATAEEMYAPDVFGRSASAVFVVEP